MVDRSPELGLTETHGYDGENIGSLPPGRISYYAADICRGLNHSTGAGRREKSGRKENQQPTGEHRPYIARCLPVGAEQWLKHGF